MTNNTAHKLADHATCIFAQSKVVHNLPLGDDGYYVIATMYNTPSIDEMDAGDCIAWTSEDEANKIIQA